MHRTIGYISKRFAHIRPGEERKVWLTFCYFFLVITAYYVIKPVSRSLVLDDLGHRVVPYIDLICAILMGPLVTIFARMVDRISKPRLVSLSFGIIIAVMLVFWKLLAWPHPWIAGVFYIWVAIFSVFAVTLFWLVANDLYRAQDAKRLFGFIGSGGILGGIVGSSIVAAGARVVGTENLLLISSGVLVACWWVVRQLWRYAPDGGMPETETLAPARRDTFLSDLRGFLNILLRSRYLLLLVSLVCINKIIAAFVYYQFNPFLEQRFPDVDALTAFTGMFFGGINVLAFVVQFFLTSWILRRWGLLAALLILPIGLLAGTATLFLVPIFWIAASTELYDRSFNYSLNNTAKEVLYLPLDRTIRYKVKPFIDMVVFRFGKGIAAILGIVLLDVLGMPVRYLSLLAIPLLACWLAAAFMIRREYTVRIRSLVQARADAQPASDQPPAAGHGADRSGVTGSLIVGPSPQQKLSLAVRLVGEEPHRAHAKELLECLERYEGRVRGTSPTIDGFEVDRLTRTIADRTIPMAVRRQAIRALGDQSDPVALDCLRGMLFEERDVTLSHEVARTLVKLRTSQGGPQWPSGKIRQQVGREMASYERIGRVARGYRQYHHGPLAVDDPIMALLRVLTEESAEQIFRLLMLVHRPEDIHLVYEQLRAPDTHVRADAIELLDNLVDPAMRATIFPILDETRFLSRFEEESGHLDEPPVVAGVFQEAIWDHNSWLSVTTLCAVGRLQFPGMREELEKASRHTEPLVSTAAKLALQFAAHP